MNSTIQDSVTPLRMMSSLKLQNIFSFLKSSIEFLDPGWPPVSQTAEVKPQIRGKHWKARGVWCGLNELIHQNPFSLGVRRTSSRCLLLIIIIIIVANASSSELKLHAQCAENPVSLSLAAGAIVPLIIWLKSFLNFYFVPMYFSRAMLILRSKLDNSLWLYDNNNAMFGFMHLAIFSYVAFWN